MSNDQYPRLKLPLKDGESAGEYMERYLLQLSALLNRQVTFSEVARYLGIPVNTVLAHKGGRNPESFHYMYLYSTFFGPEILKAYGVDLRQLAQVLAWDEEQRKADGSSGSAYAVQRSQI